MTDAQPLPDQAANPPINESDQGIEGDEIVRRIPFGALIVCTIGFLFALFALLVLRWPVNPAAPTEVDNHIWRLLKPPEGETPPAMISRLILNIGIYIIMLISLIALLIGWLRGGRAAARTLILMSCLGLMYVTGVALYLAGAVSAFGFCLMLFGGLLAWVATERLEGLPPVARKKKILIPDSPESVEA